MPRRLPPTEGFNPAVPLENLAQRAEALGQQEDPLFEQALAKGLREQGTQTIEQTEGATGITGAAQVGAATLALLEQTGQAAMAAHARRVENERAMLDLQAQLLGQAGQLREQRYTTNKQHEQFLMQLKAQQDQQKGNLGAAIAGGAISAFASGGFGGLLGGAAPAAAPAAQSTFAPQAYLQNLFAALGNK